MEVAQILRMNKGNGDKSYAKNSSVQNKIISDSKRITMEAIENVISTSGFPENITIADLGCSSGPNSLTLISDVLEILHLKCKRLGCPLPEVLVFLNDLYGNDFNCIFGSLPDFYRNMKTEKGEEFRRCFISGVPGSFYGRLFPKNSVDFVHSFSSLHWLSKVPSGLESEAKMAAMNKGKLYISSTSPQSVLDSYAEQFKKDFSCFIKSRSEEIVSGGRMVLSLMGRKSMDPTTPDSCHQWELLAQALMTMASEGIIEQGKIDTFNAPYYAPCIEEMKMEIEKEGSFKINCIETFEVDWDGFAMESSSTTTTSECELLLLEKSITSGERVAKTIRAVVESMLESHFGAHVMDELFYRFGKIVNGYLSTNSTKYTNLVFSFVKK